MTTKVNEIMNEIADMEVNLDSIECNNHIYTVEYKNGKIIISVVKEYYYYDECDEYVCEDIETEFAKIDASFEVAMNSFFGILSGTIFYYQSKARDYELYSLVHVKRFR